MTKSIYQLFLNRFTGAWYQLSENEREELMERHIHAFEQLGIKSLVFCTSGGWAAEDWDFWGIVEYPDPEAMQKLREMQKTWGWFQYVEAETVVDPMLAISQPYAASVPN